MSLFGKQTYLPEKLVSVRRTHKAKRSPGRKEQIFSKMVLDGCFCKHFLNVTYVLNQKRGIARRKGKQALGRMSLRKVIVKLKLMLVN